MEEDSVRVKFINSTLCFHCATDRKVAGSIPDVVTGFIL
jgi:hypothetical protein